jgi:micrococcal nuclease
MKIVVRHFLIATLSVASFAFPAWAQAQKYSKTPWLGVVTHVADGDTVWVRPDTGGDAVNVRLDAIDAPEICQAWGPEARAALASRVLNRKVKVSPKRRDGYGRVLAHLADGSTDADLGGWMVASGNAWAHRYKNYKSEYGAQQARAQAARKGLFADARAQNPREFRQRHGPCEHREKK